MHMVKTLSFIFGLRLKAILCALVFVLITSAGYTADDDRMELIPGLDFWCCEPEVAPLWQSEPTTPGLLPRAERHSEFMQAGVPLEYRGRRNPYPAAMQVIDNGGRLFRAHCATCHGVLGLGDGEAGRDLRPSPAFLTYLIERPRAVDEYLLWTISEGGAEFGTAMPAFKETLSELEIWQIVVYMRSGFPPVDGARQD
jgi:mono/diheme cytochrome c family protein